jgi:hypothetical protein
MQPFFTNVLPLPSSERIVFMAEASHESTEGRQTMLLSSALQPQVHIDRRCLRSPTLRRNTIPPRGVVILNILGGRGFRIAFDFLDCHSKVAGNLGACRLFGSSRHLRFVMVPRVCLDCQIASNRGSDSISVKVYRWHRAGFRKEAAPCRPIYGFDTIVRDLGLVLGGRPA